MVDIKKSSYYFLIAQALLPIAYGLNFNFRNSLSSIFGPNGLLMIFQDTYISYSVFVIAFGFFFFNIFQIILKKLPLTNGEGSKGIAFSLTSLSLIGIFYKIPPESNGIRQLMSFIGFYGLTILMVVIFWMIYKSIKHGWSSYKSNRWALAIAFIITGILGLILSNNSNVNDYIATFSFFALILGIILIPFALFKGRPNEGWVKRKSNKLGREMDKISRDEDDLHNIDDEELKEDNEADELEHEEEKDVRGISSIEDAINKLIMRVVKDEKNSNSNDIIQSTIPILYGQIERSIQILNKELNHFISFDKENKKEHEFRRKKFIELFDYYNDYHENLRTLESAEGIRNSMEHNAEEKMKNELMKHEIALKKENEEINLLNEFIKITVNIIKVKNTQLRNLKKEVKNDIKKNITKHVRKLQHLILHYYSKRINTFNRWKEIFDEKEKIDRNL